MMDLKTLRQTDETVVILPGAVVSGDVTFGGDCSVWFNAVIRGDACPVVMGRACNVQENVTVHVSPGFPVTLGDYVTVGHGAILHGCTVGSHCLIGMGSILLNGARIGDHCLIGAGSLVTGKMDAPAGSLIMGSPATVRRALNEDELAQIEFAANNYLREKELYR